MRKDEKFTDRINDFRKIINVDKTKYIHEMVNKNQYDFLSRPSRFGKSLTVSVLEYLFREEKELFEGTWIYDEWDWESYPVVRLDMSVGYERSRHKFADGFEKLDFVVVKTNSPRLWCFMR